MEAKDAVLRSVLASTLNLAVDKDPGKAFAGITGTELYLEACRLLEVVPVSQFIQNLSKPYINLNHHGLGPKGAKAIAIALVSNASVIHLELEDNWILAEGAVCIAQMLRENCCLQKLNISNNHLGTEGAEAIARLLSDNMSYLQVLQLSGTQRSSLYADEFLCTEDFSASEILLLYPLVGALDGRWLQLAGTAHSLCMIFSLQSNYQVKELDLSHNEFSEKGGQLLGQMLASNETLELLNLSWNHLSMKGAVALGTGLRNNGTLKILNLSWNGFRNEGAKALGEALKVNNVLVQLDLSSNQIDNEGAKKLCKGLEVNENLKVLKLANNPVTVEGAIALVTSIRKNPKSMMEEINISNVLVNETFIKMLDLACQEHPGLDVTYGEVEGYISRNPEHYPNPMKVLQNYLHEHNLELWDFFRNIDKDGNMKIPVAAVRRAIMQESSIPLNRVQIAELVQKLDRNHTGVVDYSHLKEKKPAQKPEEEKTEEEEKDELYE
ncbi:leucine-rich repeat-containing protein 74A [Eudromia elegans]